MRDAENYAAPCSRRAIFGGTIGALATAAPSNRRPPRRRFAAAVQRVSDSNAEQSLHSINAELGTANTRLATLSTDLSPNGTAWLPILNNGSSGFSVGTSPCKRSCAARPPPLDLDHGGAGGRAVKVAGSLSLASLGDSPDRPARCSAEVQ